MSAPQRRRWARRTLSIATTILLIGVSLLALFTVVIPFVLGAQSYTVLTGSMRPGLEPGTLIAVRPVDPAQIRIGDVITYQLEPGRPAVVTHRVVGINVGATSEPTFITRGDANNANDALAVLPVQVRGVVVFAVPFLGHINLFFQGAEKSLVVVAVGIGAIGYGVVVLFRETVRSRRRRHKHPTVVAGALVLMATCTIALAQAPPAHADDPSDVPPAGVLSLSTDGATWVSDGAIHLFGSGAPALIPGVHITTRLWIRNDSDDRATFALTASWGPHSTATPADLAFTDDLTISFDGVTAGRDVDWQGGVIAPGQMRSVEVSMALAAASGNESRQGAAQFAPTVRLTQMVDTALPPEHNPDGDGDLATTGGTVPLSLSVFAALAALAGLALVTLRSRRHPRLAQRASDPVRETPPSE